MGFIACTVEWAGFPEGIGPQVIRGGETGMITSYLWERGWEEEMVQGGLESPVGKWGWGGSLPQTLIAGEEAQGLLWCIYVSRPSGMGNHKWLAGSCSPAFHPKEVITPKPCPFIAEGLLSFTKQI